MPADSDTAKSIFASREKHLEMIQKVIERLAMQAGQMKRLGLATTVAAVGAIKVLPSANLIWGAVVLLVVFWALESKYLQQERWFRDLYDQVRSQPSEQRTDFNLRPTFAIRSQSTFPGSLISWSTAGLYLPLMLVLIWISGGR